MNEQYSSLPWTQLGENIYVDHDRGQFFWKFNLGEEEESQIFVYLNCVIFVRGFRVSTSDVGRV
jgi:hypothetical protein